MSDFTTYIKLLRIIEEGKSPNCSTDTEIQGSVRMQKASRSFLRVEYHLPLTIFVGFESSLQFYRTGSTSCLAIPTRSSIARSRGSGESLWRNVERRSLLGRSTRLNVSCVHSSLVQHGRLILERRQSKRAAAENAATTRRARVFCKNCHIPGVRFSGKRFIKGRTDPVFLPRNHASLDFHVRAATHVRPINSGHERKQIRETICTLSRIAT